MATIEARFRIVTPMFLGDADQRASAIRPPSIKGALRFWWRALHWPKLRSATSTDEEALESLHLAETALFGGAAPQGAQSQILLSVQHGDLPVTKGGAQHAGFAKHPAARYLGYGLVEAFASSKKGTREGQLTRDCINDKCHFTLRLRARGPLPPGIHQALRALGLLGGLGSRARRGFGSLALEELQEDGKVVWTAPDTTEKYAAEVANLVGGLTRPNTLPPFTAISQKSRIDIVVKNAKSSLETLESYGMGMLLYRSWGREGKVLRQESERNFKKDHDWSKGDRPKGFHPQRVVFGLPHNYGKDKKMQVTAEAHERRASPLFFHVHPVGQQYLGISILMPSVFLPPGEEINAGTVMVPANIDWAILHRLLDGKRRVDNKPIFPGIQTLLDAAP